MTAHPTRRTMLAGIGAGFALAAIPPAAAQRLYAEPGETGPGLQALFDQAAAEGRPLELPGRSFAVGTLSVPSGLVLRGVPNRTVLTGPRILEIFGANDVTVEGIGFFGGSGTEDEALVAVSGATNIVFRDCSFSDSAGMGLRTDGSGLVVDTCRFERMGDAAIHAMDGQALRVTGTTITECGNAGIRVWRSQIGRDGAILTDNRIERIDWRGGGNGQNGNGINVFRAGEVVVRGNVFFDCAFTAVRLNGSRNAIVSDNQCINSGEVAIFSEFEFSGSIISGNLVDGAGVGISITNLDSGGRLAVCTGNLVRNIFPRSEVNPDTVPIGIYAEADTVISANSVDGVPGVAIMAGWGPYLDNVVIADNVVTGSRTGIGVSVVEETGPVTITGNSIAGAEQGIVGMRWTEIAAADLADDAQGFANVAASENRIAP